jgi:hypothetical protein
MISEKYKGGCPKEGFARKILKPGGGRPLYRLSGSLWEINPLKIRKINKNIDRKILN